MGGGWGRGGGAWLGGGGHGPQPILFFGAKFRSVQFGFNAALRPQGRPPRALIRS